MINLRENEKVHLIKRRHKIVLLMEIIPIKILFFTVLIGGIVILFVPLSWPEWLVNLIPEAVEFEIQLFILLILSTLLLIFWAVFFIIFANYYLDYWIVTNERTIHAELKSLFNRTISSVPHSQIQDISVDVHGILPTVFRYGDLHIQTAGQFREFIFRQIPEPQSTKEIIFKAQKELLQKNKNFLLK